VQLNAEEQQLQPWPLGIGPWAAPKCLTSYKRPKLLTHADSDFLLSPLGYANSGRMELELEGRGQGTGDDSSQLKVQMLPDRAGSINGSDTTQHSRSIDLR